MTRPAVAHGDDSGTRGNVTGNTEGPGIVLAANVNFVRRKTSLFARSGLVP
jgi:hypothetical protein